MTKQEVLERMKGTGLVPVLRATSVIDALGIARAIAAGGVDVLEVTMTVPGAMDVIRTLVREEPQHAHRRRHRSRPGDGARLHA